MGCTLLEPIKISHETQYNYQGPKNSRFYSLFNTSYMFQMTRKDPVHSIPLKDYVLQQLRQCHNLFGDKVFHELTQQIDPEVYLQLQQFTSSWFKSWLKKNHVTAELWLLDMFLNHVTAEVYDCLSYVCTIWLQLCDCFFICLSSHVLDWSCDYIVTWHNDQVTLQS